MSIIEISKDSATVAALLTDDPHRTVGAGPVQIGATVGHDTVTTDLLAASRVAWVDHAFYGWCLGLEVDGKVVIYDNIRPLDETLRAAGVTPC